MARRVSAHKRAMAAESPVQRASVCQSFVVRAANAALSDRGRIELRSSEWFENMAARDKRKNGKQANRQNVGLKQKQRRKSVSRRLQEWQEIDVGAMRFFGKKRFFNGINGETAASCSENAARKFSEKAGGGAMRAAVQPLCRRPLKMNMRTNGNHWPGPILAWRSGGEPIFCGLDQGRWRNLAKNLALRGGGARRRSLRLQCLAKANGFWEDAPVPKFGGGDRRHPQLGDGGGAQ